MADKESTAVPVTEEEDERDLNYQPPAQKSLQEIQELDKDDESLNKYKQTLLGSGPVVLGGWDFHLVIYHPLFQCDFLCIYRNYRNIYPYLY